MEWRLCFQCSATATLENKLMVMVGKPLYILGKHGEVAFLRLGHLEGGDWLAVGCSGPRAGTRWVCICTDKPEGSTSTTSADAGSIQYPPTYCDY